MRNAPFALRIEFGAKHNYDGNPHPHHKSHYGAERAVRLVITSEIAGVPRTNLGVPPVSKRALTSTPVHICD
jgi:hypothetical protein